MENLRSITVAQILEKGADSAPSKVAVVDGDKRVTYKELNDKAHALAAALFEMGIKKDDRVAIYMKNSLELMLAFYACQKLGAVVAWISPSYRKTECEFILNNSEAKGIFIFREWDGYDYLKSISSIRDNLPSLASIIVVGEARDNTVYNFDQLIEQGYKKTFPSPSIDTQNDLSMLLYTSGTTGTPKGAMICHYATVRGGYEYSLAYNGTSEDVFLSAILMSHSYGCGSCLIQPLLLKSTVVLMPTFKVENAFELIQKEKVTLFPGAPTHFILMLNHSKRKDFDLTSLRAGLIAGYIPPEGLITRVEKELGCYLAHFWGATEAGPGAGIMCPYPSSLEVREKYIGKPLLGTKIRVVNREADEDVQNGNVGELAISGWHVMKGYWKNPWETTKQVVNGWVFMGDLVSIEQGYVKIHGRTKDLINRGAFKIYPSELEIPLSQHPKVSEVCVVATPNPVLGESVCVCVIPKAGESVKLAEIRSFLQDRVAPHKLPDELCIMEDFPKLSGGVKIRKFGEAGLSDLAQKDESREKYRR